MAAASDAPRALVIRTAGANCDAEMVRAFQRAGAEAELAHLDRLIAEPVSLKRFQVIGFPGGFSYGDDIASGRVLATRLRERLWPALREARERGALMIGVCNGFQALLQVGLLPGLKACAADPSSPAPLPKAQGEPPTPVAALVDNEGGAFIDRWLRVRFEPDSRCLWTQGAARLAAEMSQAQRDAAIRLPIAHGEGRFVAHSPAILDALEASGQVALRYIDNANGSQRAIAGVCDPTGRIFGLMPHPERYLTWRHHPFATRLPAEAMSGETIGSAIFRDAVEAVKHGREASSEVATHSAGSAAPSARG